MQGPAFILSNTHTHMCTLLKEVLAGQVRSCRSGLFPALGLPCGSLCCLRPIVLGTTGLEKAQLFYLLPRLKPWPLLVAARTALDRVQGDPAREFGGRSHGPWPRAQGMPSSSSAAPAACDVDPVPREAPDVGDSSAVGSPGLDTQLPLKPSKLRPCCRRGCSSAAFLGLPK